LDELLAALDTAKAAISVHVESTACVTEPVQCEDFSSFPAASDNRNPVRFVIQIVSPQSVDDLNLESFGVRTQFSPSGEGSVEPLICPECFENREGGTYAIWVVPSEGNWEEGLHYVLVSATVDGEVLPSLVRIEIPFRINEPPQANISIFPLAEGQVNEPINFDGSGSQDPDSIITCYKWEVLSDNPDPDFPGVGTPLVIQGRAASGFNRIFINVQTLSVVLYVADQEISGTFQCADVYGSEQSAGVEPDSAFDDVAVAVYELTCNNPPPTAVIAGPDVITAIATPSMPASILLDGRLSFDGETVIDLYVWSCGSQFTPVPVVQGDPSRVICRYPPGSYTATLEVVDQGTGVIDPNTGNFKCQKISEADTVTISVTEP
jgi:hypothetical protein